MYVRVAPLGAVLARVCPVGYTGTEGILGGHTKYAEVLGTGIEVVLNMPICRYRYLDRTELTDVWSTGIGVVPHLQKCRVPVWRSYRTYRSGYRY